MTVISWLVETVVQLLPLLEYSSVPPEIVPIFTWLNGLLSASAYSPNALKGKTEAVGFVAMFRVASVEVGGVLNTFVYSVGMPAPGQPPKTNPK